MIFDDNGQTESREKKETPYTSIHIFSLYKVIPDRANKKKKSILYFMMIGCAGYMFALYMCVVCQERKKKSKQQQAKF